jgi:arylsulfatase A-like enzyme
MITTVTCRWPLFFLMLLCWPAWLVAAELPCERDTPADRPNIVFIFSDDHATHAIGAYGGHLAAVNPTPHIDALAARGMRFQNSFCTNSICGPSRAVILTGLHSHKNGFRRNGDRFDGGQLTFPKLLQQAGYQTAMIGKWHLSSDPQGFDEWDILPGQGDYYNPEFIRPGNQRTTVTGHCTDIVTDKAIAWMEKVHRDDRPFMLMCQHKAPHRAWMPALRHLDLYADITIPEPDTLFDKWEDNASGARYQQMQIDRHLHPVYDLHLPLPDNYDPEAEQRPSLDKSAWRNLKKMNEQQRAEWDRKWKPRNEAFAAANLQGDELVRWKYQRYIRNYLRCVRGVDESVGRIVQWLQDQGLSDNTVVIYSSDQGFYLGDHGWYDKRWMYEESMLMPLVVCWPGVTSAGSVNIDLVQNLDYAPTFLEIAGVEIPETMQGRSLVPLLKGRTPSDWRTSLYYHYFEYPAVHMVPRHCGVRTASHKLMHFYQFDEWECYDLRKDADEVQNVYDDPEYASLIADLKQELVRLQKQYDDQSDRSVMPPEWQARYRNADQP